MKVYITQSMRGYDGQAEFPIRIKEELRKLEHTVFDPYEFENVGWTDEQIVKTDLDLVDQSDLLIAFLVRPSYGGGSYGELYKAAWRGTPIIFVGPPDMYGPWMRYHCAYHVAVLPSDGDGGTNALNAQVEAVLDCVGKIGLNRPCLNELDNFVNKKFISYINPPNFSEVEYFKTRL